MWKAPSLSPTPATVLPLFSPRLIDRLRFLFLETLFKTGRSSQLCLRGFKLNYPNIIPFEITTSGFRGKREFQRRRVIVEKRKEETWPSWPLEIIMNGERPSLANWVEYRSSRLSRRVSRMQKERDRSRYIAQLRDANTLIVYPPQLVSHFERKTLGKKRKNRSIS